MGGFFDCNFFSLFKLPPRFELDGEELKSRYLSLQAGVHPDRFVARPPGERRAAMQMSGRINEGFETLRRPLSRAAYMLSLRGYDVFAESDTAMPGDFLMRQIEWRERLQEAGRDEGELRAIRAGAEKECTAVTAEVSRLLAADDDSAAVCTVRRWRYWEKMMDDIDALLQ